jgi:raffinose/stachyose/melibiose transport system permease protein
MIQAGFKSGNFAFVCAFSVVFFLIVFAISRILMTIFGKWEGAVT